MFKRSVHTMALATLALVGTQAEAQSGAQVKKSAGHSDETGENEPHIVYPKLGEMAGEIAVVFDAPDGAAQRAAIYVLESGIWKLLHHGPYGRGSVLSGKGGKGKRFRLITLDEEFADLVHSDGRWILRKAGENLPL